MCLLFAHHPKRLFVGHRMDICRALQRGFGVSITWTCPRGLVSDFWRKKIFVEPSKVLHNTDGSLLRRRTLHGYLWNCSPKFYITRTCPRGSHGADATDHSAVGLDQATGRPDKTEHALLAFQKAKENTIMNANTNTRVLTKAFGALKTEYTMFRKLQFFSFIKG